MFQHKLARGFHNNQINEWYHGQQVATWGSLSDGKLFVMNEMP